VTVVPGAQELSLRDPARAAAYAHLLDELVDELRRFEWTEVPCAVCGEGQDLPVAFEQHGIALRRCASCSHVFVSPRLPDAAVPTLYSSAYWDRYMRALGRPMLEERLVLDYQNAWERLRRDVLPRRSSGRLLDVGAASGGLVKAAGESGFQAIGIEPSNDACELARRAHGIDLICTTLPEYHAAPESFDVVSYYNVLGHLLDPRRELEAVRRALAPGGLLVIETPTAGSLALAEEGLDSALLEPVAHVHLFTEGNGARLAEECGLRVLDLYCPHEDALILLAEPA
jgi:SAM-dependent methyltransferase